MPTRPDEQPLDQMLRAGDRAPQRLAATLADPRTRWPLHLRHRRQMRRRVEAFLRLGPARFLPYAPLRPDSPTRSLAGSGPLPEASRQAIDAMAAEARGPLGEAVAGGPALEERMGHSAAEELYCLLERDVARQMRQARAPSGARIEALDPLSLFGAICEVVSTRVRYSRGIFGSRLTLEPTGGPRGWLLHMELVLTSALKLLALDRRPLAWLARQPFEQDLDAMCRHYGAITQILFEVARRRLPQLAGWRVVTLVGAPHPGAPFDHAWTWLVDLDAGRVFPCDLTNTASPRRLANTSAFLNTLLLRASAPGAAASARRAAAAVLPLTLATDSIQGQQLLLNLAGQSAIHPQVSARIVGFLTGSPLARALPDWRMQLETARAVRRLYGSVVDAPIQHEIFDTVI